MYNKYLDEMKKSDLKEAIKSEIKSILTEAVGDKLDDNSSKADELSTKIDDIEGKLEEDNLDEIAFGAAGTEKRTGQVVGEIIELIRSTGVDASEVMEELGQEFGISFEFGRESFADIREEEEPTAADVKKEKSIAKEKADALKTKEKIDKIKKDLKKNKSELLKISKIDRKERTKAEQSLFDSMVDKTKELKKLEKSL